MCAVPLECAPCVRFQSICAYYPHVNRHQAHHHRGTSSAFSHITRSSRLHSPSVAVEMSGLAFLGSAEFSTMAHSLSLSPIRSPDSTTHAIINQTALVACFSLGPPDRLERRDPKLTTHGVNLTADFSDGSPAEQKSVFQSAPIAAVRAGGVPVLARGWEFRYQTLTSRGGGPK